MTKDADGCMKKAATDVLLPDNDPMHALANYLFG